jgi:hypothetical protein
MDEYLKTLNLARKYADADKRKGIDAAIKSVELAKKYI